MSKIINLGNKKEAIEILEKCKSKIYDEEFKIINIYLNSIVDKNNKKIFEKADLYVLGSTLFTCMQSFTKETKGHNPHNLTSEEVYYSLKTIKDTNKFEVVEIKRYKIVTLCISISGHPVIVIIDKDAALKANKKARVNKLVTIYPNRHEKIIENQKKIIDLSK